MSLFWSIEDNVKKVLPDVTIYPEWVPNVGETIQLLFDNNFYAEDGYVNKARVKSVSMRVDSVLEHEQEGGQKSYFLTTNILGRVCQIKLSKRGLSRFDEAQMNHGNTGLPNEFYVLRFPEDKSILI